MSAMRPLFADPKTDFVFKKLFGTEEHKPLLIALLNGLLELDEAHRVVQVEVLSPEQWPLCGGDAGAQRGGLREARRL